jgi:hypothetical protein
MQALRLNWPRCRKGYEVLEIRREDLDAAGNLRLPADATPAERRLVERWGRRLSKDFYFHPDQEIVRVIQPRDEKMPIANVLATAPDCFIEFANINGSEARLLDFANKFGCLDDRFPPYVAGYLGAAARFQKVLGKFEVDKQTGSKRWLSSFEELRPRVIESLNGSDLKIVPTIEGGEIQVLLEPPDLLTAIWLQFLLKAANDMTLTHCDSCRNFIAVAGNLGRSDKRFCSAACKQRDYRRREAEKKASRSRATGARRVANRRQST